MKINAGFFLKRITAAMKLLSSGLLCKLLMFLLKIATLI